MCQSTLWMCNTFTLSAYVRLLLSKMYFPFTSSANRFTCSFSIHAIFCSRFDFSFAFLVPFSWTIRWCALRANWHCYTFIYIYFIFMQKHKKRRKHMKKIVKIKRKSLQYIYWNVFHWLHRLFESSFDVNR